MNKILKCRRLNGVKIMKELIEFIMCGREGDKCSPYKLTASIERQKLLLLINARPLDIESIARRLDLGVEEVTKHLDELLYCGLIKEENGFYRPAFPIFTVADQKILTPLLNELVDDVVEVVKSWLPKIREVLIDVTVIKRGLEFPDLDYIVVGALTLDYEGLNVLSEERLLVKSKAMPGGGEYIFSGFEGELLKLKKSVMWGHSAVFGGYWFNTHGSLPPVGVRLAFPDLAWLWYAQGVKPDEITHKMIELGRILEVLAERDLSFEELRRELGMDIFTLAINLTLLSSTGYVKPINLNCWRLTAPVLMAKDYEAIKSISKALLKDIAVIFKKKLYKIIEVYKETSPAKNEIPLEEAFNPIYHLIFEQALNKLLAEGVIVSPKERIDGGKYSAFLIVLQPSK